MRLRNLPYVDFDAGDPDQPPLTLAGQSIALSICYEDAFGAEQLVFLPQATLLVNISNDAWFGDSIAPHQHLQIARMRAIESGRYMLRATNTGISAVIAADGTVEQLSPQFKPDVLVADIAPYRGATPYVITGNWLVVILAILMLLAGQVRYPLRPYGHDLQT
jgi:apolipoprotein N-acyltransferase